MVDPAEADLGAFVVEARAELDQTVAEFEQLLENAYGLIVMLQQLSVLNEAIVPAFLAAADQIGGAINELRLDVSRFPDG